MSLVRLVHQDDVRSLTLMLNSSGGMQFFKAIFGQFHFPKLIDTSNLSLICEHSNDERGFSSLNPLKGFASLSDAIPLLNGDHVFEAAIYILNFHIPVTIHNALFVNFWMVDEKSNAAQNLIYEAFNINPHLEYILWTCPISFIADTYVENNFSTIFFDPSASKTEYPEGVNPKQVFGQNKVIYISRSKVLPHLKVRSARVEDNDDLIPIIERSNAKMLEGQDSYFLAELIDSQDPNNIICVGLANNEIQGMLATSLDVNMSLIMKIFDIDPYPDLIIKADQLPPPPPLVLSVIGDLRLINKATIEITLAHHNCLFINAEKMRIPSELGEGESKHGDGGNPSLQSFINHLIEEHGNPNLQAIVFWGFPRSEQDIHTYKHAIFFETDAVIELTNTAEDVDDDEEDEFLQLHLDSVEVLREIYFNQDPEVFSGPLKPKLQWKKVTFEKDSLQNNRPEDLQKLLSSVSVLLDDHKQKVEATEAINNEKPPRANGFAVTALCLESEFHSRAIDLIKFAFEQQPDVDYCLYMLPCQDDPTMLTTCFNFVKTRAGVSFDQSLYIINRAYFYALEYLKVVRANPAALNDVYQFIQPVRQRDRLDIVETIQRAVEENDVEAGENPSEIAFTVMIHNKMVGLVMLSRKMLSNDDITWYRNHYHLDEVLNLSRHLVKNQYVLTHWLIDPVLSSLSSMVLHDIMRSCHKSVFYYHCDKMDPCPKEIVENFVLVRPMQVPEGPQGQTVQRPTHATHTLGSDAPLFCLVKHYLARSKDIVGKRLVIVGGSAQSYAFMETLCSLQDIYLPNIYFVVPIPPPPLKEADFMIKDAEESKHDEEFSGCLSLQDVDYPMIESLWAMGYFHRLNVIRGQLTDIDRENKAVVLSDEIVLEYDYLLISSSTQDNSHRRIATLANVHPAKCADAGIFTLGNPAADLLALSYVKKRMASRPESVVIAGKGVKVLAAAESLIRAGLEPSKIACVVEESPSLIENCGEAVLSNLVAQSGQVGGIKEVYFKAAVNDVSLSRTGFVQAVDLYEISTTVNVTVSKNEAKQELMPIPQNLACSALLLCAGPEHQSCERDVFAAINDCGLVFDGGLVVDMNFRTVDPNIYAVADFTKFSRVYREDTPHARYNPREVGIFVALQVILQHLHPQPNRLKSVHKSIFSAHLNQNLSSDHSVSDNSSAKSNFKNPKIQFSLPRSFCAFLPGDVHYFHSILPKVPRELISYPTDNALPNPMRFGPPPPRRITILKADAFGTVSELIYAGLDKVESRNLRLITGKQDMYLNSAAHAYQRKLVDDWITFFRANWATPLYQDNFLHLMATLKRNLQSDKGMIMLLSRTFEKAELDQDNVAVAEFREAMVGAHGELAPEITRKIIEAETLEYLKENKDFLPKLYVPTGH